MEEAGSAAQKPKVIAFVVVIAVTALLTVAATSAAGGKRSTLMRLLFGSADGVAVHEVRVDRKNRSFVDIVFSKPVATERIGEVMTEPPASFYPMLHGVWRWYTGNILRFEPAGPLPIASEYKLVIAPDKISTKELPFEGEREFVLKTDEFLVRRVTFSELPSANATVVLQGDVQFNYRVNPEALAPRIHIDDPLAGRVKVELISSYGSDTITWRTPPIAKDRKERDADLVIDKDLFPADGNVTLGADYHQKVHIGSRENLTVNGTRTSAGETESTISIDLTSPVTPEALAEKLTITPPVKFHIESEGNVALVIGRFTPGKSYDLVINEGLVASDTALLKTPYKQTIAVPDLDPLLDFQSEGMFLSASGKRNVAIDTINVTKAKLAIDRVYRNNLFFYLQEHGSSYDYDDEDDEYSAPYYRAYFSPGRVEHRYGDRIVEKDLTFPAGENKRHTSTIPIGSLVRSASPGLYKVTVYRDDDEWRGTTRWILLTDLGIVAKRARNEMLVWVASFADLGAIGNANVSLIDDQNQTLARGKTDANGFWTARSLSADAHPFMIVVERGSDFSFLLLGNSSVEMSAFDVSGDTSSNAYSAFLYGERTLYRPGETLEGVAVVRTRDLAVPPQMPLVLRHTDPTGEVRGSQRLTADSSGIATYQVDVPSYARTGRHTLELLAGETVIGSSEFNVEEFVPDRIKVDIETPDASKNGKLDFSVSSAYLFGAPAASLDVETKVRLVPTTFQPEHFEDFTFSSDSRKFDPRDVSTDSSTLDENGRKSYSIELPQKLLVPSSLQAVVTSRVQEQGGRGVSALSRVPVHPYPYYVGVREKPQSARGNERHFEWVAVSPEEKEIAASTLRADIYEERWHTVMRQTSNGGYAYESTRDSELLKTIPISAGKTRGDIPFVTRGWGSYRLVVTDPASGAATELTFDAWDGSGYSPWAMKNPGRLELSVDKKSYRAGESAALTIKSPFRGKALVTVERDRVFYSTTVTLTSNSARVAVPLALTERPNAYITATVVRTAEDLEPGEAGRAFGAVRVDVERAENELHPEIQTVEEMRSARTLKVSVKATPNARVTVAAVDEGILQLVAESRPDPFEYFYRRLALEVATHDIFAQLLPEVAARNKAIAGGSDSGEGISQFLRTDGMRRPKPVSYWSGVLTADSNGIVNTTFQIPDFQGAVRVTAVVHSGEQFGSSDKLVRVHDPIVIMPTVPRFASTGDAFSLPLTVRNDTKSNATFDVAIGVKGSASIAGEATQHITIPRNRESTVLFPLRTSALRGDVTVSFTATGNGERAVASAFFPVYPSLPDATDENSGTVNDRTMTLPVANTPFVSGSATREVIISPYPLVRFRGRLDYLVHYPYGCVEQTTSTAFPMIYLADLATELDPESFRARSAPAMVREAIRRLATMQTPTGGFAMWPYGDAVNGWGTVYATHFLVEAKRAGYSVDALELNRALDYLAQVAKARPNYDHDGLQETVYALFVLARAGKADLGTMDFIREKHAAELSFESRALLGAAYGAVGNSAAVSSLLGDIEREEVVQRQTGDNYNSTTRNRALVVLALLDAAPDDPRLPKLADRLARDLSRESCYYYTTQESATGLVALGQYYQMRRANATYHGTLLLDGKPYAKLEPKTMRFSKIPASGVLTVSFEPGYVANAAYYIIRTRGTPTEEGFRASSSGLNLKRDLLDRYGQPLSGNSVAQGDIVVIRTTVESTSGHVDNVVVQNLLPAGLEVENPRLATTESLPWVNQIAAPQHADIRDDRVLFFVDLSPGEKPAFYTVARAVTPGEFKLAPAQAEAMYVPTIRATEALGTFKVTR